MFKSILIVLSVLASSVSFNPDAYSLIDMTKHTSLAFNLAAYVDNVPETVLKDLAVEGYKISLTEQPGSSYGIKYIDGVTDTTQNLIFIKSYKGKFRKAVVHEIGHAWDDCLKFPSKSDKFNEIYEAEKEQIVVLGVDNPAYCKQNPQEYFAEAFQMYIYEEEALKYSAPRTYKFISDLFSER